ncbi:MAG: ribonuclease P protein component [Cyanobacteriota bacterium]
MLPKDERLRKKKEFDRVFKLKCSAATKTIVIYIETKNPDLNPEHTKIGFIVGKKVHKKANKRNKIKRRMREAYRNIRKINSNLVLNFESIILIARPSILDQDYFQIQDSILKCLNKANKLVKNKAC